MSRRTGIDDKMVFYVRRYPEPEIGSYFEYRVDKEICNPYDPFKFYMKIGGITFLPKKHVPGKRIHTSAEGIKDSKFFGSYVYYGETDRKIRCVLYAKRKGLPDMKLVAQSTCLHSIIPRYDGCNSWKVITGMKIFRSNWSERQWSRYDSNTKPLNRGFHEILETDDFNHMFRIDDLDDLSPKIGIYVGTDTSLLMVDAGRAHLFLDYTRNFVYTLFQEGAFVCTNRPFTLCFYDEEEDEEYDFKRLWLEKKKNLSKTKHLKRLRKNLGENKNKIFFLKSAPNLTFWTLRANRIRRNREFEVQLCIPTDGQIEDILFWDEGIAEVKRRQSSKPWNKYIEAVVEPNPTMQDIDLDLNEPYPK